MIVEARKSRVGGRGRVGKEEGKGRDRRLGVWEMDVREREKADRRKKKGLGWRWGRRNNASRKHTHTYFTCPCTCARDRQFASVTCTELCSCCSGNNFGCWCQPGMLSCGLQMLVAVSTSRPLSILGPCLFTQLTVSRNSSLVVICCDVYLHDHCFPIETAIYHLQKEWWPRVFLLQKCLWIGESFLCPSLQVKIKILI